MENQDLMPTGSDQGNKQDLWIDLPPEILSLILSNLDGGDKAVFHAVCKTWQSITNIAPPRPQPLPSQFDDPCPWLIHIFSDKFRFIHPIHNYYTCSMDLPAQLSGGLVIRFSKYGWLLMTTPNYYQSCLYLFNPLTKEVIELPRLPCNLQSARVMFFTCSPSEPSNCVVVIIGGYDRIGFHKLGKPDWEIIHGGLYLPSLHRSCFNPILYKGLYYIMDREGNLGVLNLDDKEHIWTWIAHKLIPDFSISSGT
ncbi:hypothetical protein COLO4_31189 [Corchorus olitorius]|uniref:Uncharacterized protein n=1 Tax=Corchorus olitorius TaxID=93759 RepID=A0A1R3H5B8_9ROSI|nr:hypothetical protein COLO4_31189 [Corchorus olitorius]